MTKELGVEPVTFTGGFVFSPDTTATELSTLHDILEENQYSFYIDGFTELGYDDNKPQTVDEVKEELSFILAGMRKQHPEFWLAGSLLADTGNDKFLIISVDDLSIVQESVPEQKSLIECPHCGEKLLRGG